MILLVTLLYIIYQKTISKNRAFPSYIFMVIIRMIKNILVCISIPS